MLVKSIIFTILLKCVLCDTDYRLNTKVIPTEYDITIKPYFDTGDKRAFTFDGEVTIKVSTAESGIKQIKLHSEDLIFSSENVTIRNKNGIVPLNPKNSLEFNETCTFAYINLENPLLANVEYNVRIIYRGQIRTDMFGLYRMSYTENGETKWAAASQFGEVHARKVIPCFDEPQLKAKFTLVIDRPANYSPTLTNTKLQSTTILNNGYVREKFFPTPLMSTYLIAILVSEFSNGGHIEHGDREISIWARPDAVNQTDYAFDVAKRVVAELGKYLGVDYYSIDNNLKLKYIALSEFIYDGMENWGIVQIREEAILYDPLESTPFYKYLVSHTVAHETTHMWFGDLVTCHWWSDLWLNEGFAAYFQNYIVSIINPELGTADLQVTLSLYTAYTVDEFANPDPLSNNKVSTPKEVDALFNRITYSKGSSIIRMIHHWIGNDAFKKGLNYYLNAGRFGSVTPSMLYTALDTGARLTQPLTNYPDYTVAKVMSAWVSQSGHPLLHVILDQDTGMITLTQSRFYADGNASNLSNELYPIPITYTTQSAANFDNTKPAFIMADKTHSFGNFLNAGWVIFNLQETGFYRVNYDNYLWSLIGDTLRGPNRTTIHHLNRAKIVNDLFALAVAKQITFNQLMARLQFLAEETDYSVWSPAVTGFNNVRGAMLNIAEGVDLDALIKRLLKKVIESLGYDERPNDSFVTIRNRMQITEFACNIGYEGCVEHAVSVFRSFRDKGKRIPPSLRPVAYCYGLKHGSLQDYAFMLKRQQTINVASESRVIGAALYCIDMKK